MRENQKKQKGRFSNMAKNKHYSVDEAKKVIYADILALTAKEEAEVEKFVKFGFTVENRVEAKANIDRLNDAYIMDYLKDDAKGLETYKAKKNETATDAEGKAKTTTTGKRKTKGFNAGRNWFARNYPADTADIEKAITEAGLMPELKKAYPEYTKKCEKAVADGSMKTDDVMSEVEYKRDFYWKKVFVRK